MSSGAGGGAGVAQHLGQLRNREQLPARRSRSCGQRVRSSVSRSRERSGSTCLARVSATAAREHAGVEWTAAHARATSSRWASGGRASTSSRRGRGRAAARTGRRRERADADLEPVRRRVAVVGVVLHVPEVAELVLGPGGGPARTRRLHGEPAHHQPLDQAAERGRVARGRAPRVGRRTSRSRPWTAPRPSASIGSTPSASARIQSAPGGDLGRAGRRSPRRSSPPGRAAITSRSATHAPAARGSQRLLGARRGDRRAERGVAVHRGRGGDAMYGRPSGGRRAWSGR